MDPSTRVLRRPLGRSRLAGLILPLLFAACSPAASTTTGVASLGSPAPSSSPAALDRPSAEKTQQAFLDYAKCMRDNGIDFPDPKVNGGAVTIGPASGSGGSRGATQFRPDSAEFKKADAACKHFIDGVVAEGGGPPSLSPEQQESLVKFTQCMREHGIDMPDPNTNGGGAVSLSTDPDGKDFKAAEEACRSFLANLPEPESVSQQ